MPRPRRRVRLWLPSWPRSLLRSSSLRAALLCTALGSAGPAQAAPVELSLTNTVPAGKKPSLLVVATETISTVSLEIERQEDHKVYKMKGGPLRAGERLELAIGDGKSGRAHWKGRLVVRAASGEVSNEVTFESSVGAAGAGLKLSYDRAHLDLEHGRLEFQVNRPPASAELVVIGEDGGELSRVQQSLAGQKAGAWLAIVWPPTPTPVLRLELKLTAESGDVVRLKLVPWSVAIPHEEVIFPSGASAIPAAEEKKLDASYQLITDAVDKVRRHEPGLDVRVYVAGHTDTVGGTEDNRRLSQARALAIATWFRARGLPLPLYYAGFGEDQPRVKTADNTDEARNRRVDYVVGVEEPANARGRYGVMR